MKKKNRILSIFVMIIIILLVAIPNVLASFADFTDEQADKQAQEQIKEQEKEHNITEVKSSDNYLIELHVEGYELTPEFDKQTLEYTINGEIKSEQINIKAKASNDKAAITGIGIVKIEEDKNDYRVEVTAENGSVRTYIIRLKEKIKDNQENIQDNNELIEATIENENMNLQSKNEMNISNIIIYIIIGMILIVLIIVLVSIKMKNKKGKH